MKSKKLFEAIEFAANAHAGQFRKGTNIPYIIHPLRVAKLLIESGCSEETVIAGILHDTVEDTSTTLEDIRQKFSKTVAQIVKGVSEPDKLNSWKNRKRHTIEYLKIAPMNVLFVACADKLDNIKAIREAYARLGETVWTRFKRSKEHQRWYYQALAEIFVSRINNKPAEWLCKQFQNEVQKVFGLIRNKYDKKDSIEIGEKAENIFAKIAITRGWKISKATDDSNINEHWDFLIEKNKQKYRVDVKSMKRISRSNYNVQDNWFWVELHGVRNYDRGWLYDGKAELIAIEKKRSFLIVRRTDLIPLVEQLVDYNSTVFAAKNAKYKIYSRPQRVDKVTMIETEKLNPIKWAEWLK